MTTADILGLEDIKNYDPRDAEPCYFDGIVYNNGIVSRITDVLDPSIINPETDARYPYDNAVRLTHGQMNQDLTGLPILFEHKPDKVLGRILHNYLDENNDLHIIGEVFDKNDLQKWVKRNVRAGLFTDLSIGHDTYVTERTRKVRHKGIQEVSFVIGGFFPGCEVKVRASNNGLHKNSPEQQKATTTVRIVKVMATNNPATSMQTTTQNSTTDASSGQAPTSMDQTSGQQQPPSQNPNQQDEQTQLLVGVAEMKKMLLDMKAENDQLRQQKQLWEESEKKRREDYATSNQSKYEQAMQVLQELAKNDGQEDLGKFEDELKYSALNPEGKEMFENMVRVTASVRSLQEQNQKIKSELAEVKKQNALARDLALGSFRTEEEYDARRKVSRGHKAPIEGIMEPDPQAPPAPKGAPAWMSMVTGIRPSDSGTVWRLHGIETNSNPPISQGQQASPPVLSQQTEQQQAPPDLTKEKVLPRPVNATGATQQQQQMFQRPPSQQFRSAYNPEIRYPVERDGMMGSSTHGDVWSFIRGVSGDSGFNAMTHLAGKDFGKSH